MLELHAVSKASRASAVDRVSFVVHSGEVARYLGPNGSGKATNIKMLAGLMEMTSGAILFDGVPIHRDLIAYKPVHVFVSAGQVANEHGGDGLSDARGRSDGEGRSVGAKALSDPVGFPVMIGLLGGGGGWSVAEY